MMRYTVVFLFMFWACSPTGDKFYTDNYGEEGITLNTDTAKRFIVLSSSIYKGSDSVFVRIDFATKDSSNNEQSLLKELFFNINNTTSDSADRRTIEFDDTLMNLDLLKDVLLDLSEKKFVRLEYIFSCKKIENLDSLQINVHLETCNKESSQILKRSLHLFLHKRYKTWFGFS